MLPRPRRRRGGGHGTFGPAPPHPPPCTDFDRAYFKAYSHVGVHEEMIKDRVRTETYRKAILRYQSSIAGKVVMDVGCGTGILSIFCARAGARRAHEVVKANKLSDKVIVLHGRVEDVDIDEKIDVIISEWMGYMLLYELYMAPITNAERYSDSIDFWRNVHGINMSPMMPLAKQFAFEEPSIETITGENVLTWPSVVMYVDCYTVLVQELESVAATYKFSSMMQAPLHGFAFWFDVEFNGPANPSTDHPQTTSGTPSLAATSDGSSEGQKLVKADEPLVLSTAPEDTPTHWQQTIVYFYDPIMVEQDQIIEGSVTISQSSENRRFLNIHLSYTSGGRSFVKLSVLR